MTSNDCTCGHAEGAHISGKLCVGFTSTDSGTCRCVRYVPAEPLPSADPARLPGDHHG